MLLIEFQSFFLSERLIFLNEGKASIARLGRDSLISAMFAFIINTKQSSSELDDGTQ